MWPLSDFPTGQETQCIVRGMKIPLTVHDNRRHSDNSYMGVNLEEEEDDTKGDRKKEPENILEEVIPLLRRQN